MSSLEDARLWLIAKRPYLSTGIFRLHYVESKEVPTLGVSKRWVCYYNPEFCSSLTVPELGTIICHELYHLLRLHHSRRGGRDPELWNSAGDFEINDDLSELRLPSEALIPQRFGLPDGKIVEEYYEMLLNKKMKTPQTGGSGSNGVNRPWESHENEGISESMAEVVRRQVAEDISKSTSNVPADLKRWANELLKPVVKWHQILRRQIYHAAGLERGLVDYSYQRRNRRQTGKIILPSFVKPKLTAAIIIDTSGSIYSEELDRFLSECKCLISLCSEVTCYIFDTKLHWKGKINSVEKAARNLRGGGGTRLDEAIKLAVKDRHKLIVVFTDGLTPWPQTRPQARVIVVTTDQPGPEWAVTVKI